MKPTVVIDTNILLRYLRNDHPTLSIKAKKIFDKAYKNDVNIYFDEIVLAETIWVLSSYFKTPKSIIVSTLLEQLYFDWIINPRKKLMIKALGLFGKTNLSYIDCWIFTVNQSLKTTSLETFDSDLKKLK